MSQRQDSLQHHPVRAFRQIVRSRYAAKRFRRQSVPPAQLTELMDLIRLAPTAYNLQPWRVVLVDDEDHKRALLAPAYDQAQIITCSHLFVFCANTQLEPLIDQLESQALAAGTEKQTVGSFVGTIRRFAAGLDESARLAWAQKQTYLALANGLNGAQSLGLDACPMEGFNAAEFARVLDLPGHLVPTVLMPVGFAVDEPRPKFRFGREQMFQTHRSHDTAQTGSGS